MADPVTNAPTPAPPAAEDEGAAAAPPAAPTTDVLDAVTTDAVAPPRAAAAAAAPTAAAQAADLSTPRAKRGRAEDAEPAPRGRTHLAPATAAAAATARPATLLAAAAAALGRAVSAAAGGRWRGGGVSRPSSGPAPLVDPPGASSSPLLRVPANKGLALRVPAGHRLQVINTHGQQVADVWAFADVVGPGGLLVGDVMSMHHSHDVMQKLVPAVGDTLVSGRSTPMLTLVADTGPGVHDTTVAACSHELYERVLGISPDEPHDSCTANLHASLAALGLRLTPGDDPSFFLTPAPINLWMSTAPLHGPAASAPPPPAGGGGGGGGGDLWGVPDPRQRPGDYVVWRAEADLVVALSACPASDVSGVNGPGGRSHDVHVRLLPPL